jgi:lipopolysaccharide biosynthesis protein
LDNKFRPIAIYLPQFHPIPENDEWWGKGFTEWTNVTKVKPKFEGHYQPHLPADLGFYDLRLHETMIAQAKLAEEYGIHGFMFYHYWFSGKRILERPVNQWLENKSPDFPFCICWANENWSRRWDGMEHELLLKQEYCEEDDKLHFKELARYFEDERYIKIDGKPFFAVYRTYLFPNIKRTAEVWREEAKKHGFKDIYLVSVSIPSSKHNHKEIGFDASIEFQPDFNNLPQRIEASLLETILHKLGLKESGFINNCVYDYEETAKMSLLNKKFGDVVFPGITPMWDNSARRQKGAFVLHNSTPEKFGNWLSALVKKFTPNSKDENFIFINAWNEWAEGCHLEPCRKWGLKYLQILKETLSK